MLSQIRRMTEALVTVRPVVRSTRSKTRLKVRLLDTVWIPSSSRMSRALASRSLRSSSRVCRSFDASNPVWLSSLG